MPRCTHISKKVHGGPYGWFLKIAHIDHANPGENQRLQDSVAVMLIEQYCDV